MAAETWISVDVETSGPTPHTGSLLAVGACLVEDETIGIEVLLRPDPAMPWTAEAEAIHRLDRATLEHDGLDPAEAMERLEAWVHQVVPDGSRPVFVALNAPFDWMWVADAFSRHLGRNPFGASALDIKALYLGRHLPGVDAWGDTGRVRMLERYPVSLPHTHTALADAQEQGVLCRRILEGARVARAELEASRESERRHREVIGGIDAVVWDDDLVTGRYFLSRRVEALTGYPPDVFSSFEFWSGNLHPDDRERVVAAITGDDDADIEYRMRVADGSWRWFRDRLTVVRDEAGEAVRRYGLMFDVTERRELQERIRRSERLSSVGQLAAAVSHDFDNVLYGIRMFADHLAATHPDAGDPVRVDAEAIAHAVESASGLTRSLLAFAREQPASDGRVVIDDVVRRLEPMLGAVVGSRVTPVLRLRAGGVVTAGEAAALEQAVLNLVINARDAMPDGGSLTVSTRVLALDDEDAAELDVEPGRGVLLEVADTGAGMDEETRSRAFEPYYTTKPVGRGTGLGLATVFGTIKRSGGGIAIDSAPGRGTTVSVFLPEVAALGPVATAGEAPA